MEKYSNYQLQRAVETLALQNLVLCDQVEDLERKVEFYRALSFDAADRKECAPGENSVRPDCQPHS